MASLLHHLGSRGNLVREFEQSLIDESSKNIAIDGHMRMNLNNGIWEIQNTRTKDFSTNFSKHQLQVG